MWIAEAEDLSIWKALNFIPSSHDLIQPSSPGISLMVISDGGVGLVAPRASNC